MEQFDTLMLNLSALFISQKRLSEVLRPNALPYAATQFSFADRKGDGMLRRRVLTAYARFFDADWSFAALLHYRWRRHCAHSPCVQQMRIRLARSVAVIESLRST